MDTFHPTAVVAATVAALVGLLALLSAGSEIVSFFDPCTQWGYQGPLSPSESCPSVTSVSETKGEALARMALIQGTTLVATGLAVTGTLRRDGRWHAGATVLFGAVTVPLLLGGYFFVPLVAAVACGVAASATWGGDRHRQE